MKMLIKIIISILIIGNLYSCTRRIKSNDIGYKYKIYLNDKNTLKCDSMENHGDFIRVYCFKDNEIYDFLKLNITAINYLYKSVNKNNTILNLN